MQVQVVRVAAADLSADPATMAASPGWPQSSRVTFERLKGAVRVGTKEQGLMHTVS